MKLAPIALFVYNRPEHTRQTVEALLRNPLAAQSELFIFSDAAKTPDIQDRVEQVRAYIRTVDGFKSVQLVEREKNFGLANSIIEGVTKLCDDYGRVIVLEDDLVVAPTFLNYMNEALAKYQDNEKVMQISGYMFPLPIQVDSDAFFLPFTTSWGWATWKRAWEKFDPEASSYEQLAKNKMLRHQFDLYGTYPYFQMLESQIKGKIDSWAIRWYLSVFFEQGLTLYPPTSLVMNNGMDGTGTHCGVVGYFQTLPVEKDYSFRLPDTLIATDHTAAVASYIRMTMNQSFKTRLFNLIRKIKGIFV